MFLTVISFYTPTWEYEQHAERLRKECDDLNLRHHIRRLDDTGSWLSNTRLKSKFIQNTMANLDCPILWIDVDGSICKRPVFIESNSSNYDFIGRHQRTGPMRTWHVGTMYFNNTPITKTLINRWADSCGSENAKSDEAVFEDTWHSIKDEIRYCEMPEEYFHILADGVPYSNTVIGHRLSKCESKLEMKRRNARKQNENS